MEEQFQVIRIGGAGYERTTLLRRSSGQEVWVHYIDPEEELKDGLSPQLPPDGVLCGELYIEWVLTAETSEPGRKAFCQPKEGTPSIEIWGQVLEVRDEFDSVWDLGELGQVQVELEQEQEVGLQAGGWYTAVGSLGLRLSDD